MKERYSRATHHPAPARRSRERGNPVRYCRGLPLPQLYQPVSGALTSQPAAGRLFRNDFAQLMDRMYGQNKLLLDNMLLQVMDRKSKCRDDRMSMSDPNKLHPCSDALFALPTNTPTPADFFHSLVRGNDE